MAFTLNGYEAFSHCKRPEKKEEVVALYVSSKDSIVAIRAVTMQGGRNKCFECGPR